MTTETYVQLPTDGSGTKVRVVSLPEPGTSGTTTVVQEVVTLADSAGNLLESLEIGIADLTTQTLLRGVLLRLDCLNAALDKRYQPPDDLSY